MSDTVRVRAKGTALCPDFDALDRGVRRMIGRNFKEVSPNQWGWEPTNADEVVRKSREIAWALADGSLWPADVATAVWATSVTTVSVVFDPTFGKGD